MVRCSLGKEEPVIGKRTEKGSGGRAQGDHNYADL